MLPNFPDDSKPPTPVRKKDSTTNPSSPNTPPNRVGFRNGKKTSVFYQGDGLVISNERHSTSYGSKQKNHATPHLCLFQILSNLFENTDVKEIGDVIKDIADVFLPDRKQKFLEIMAEFQKEIDEIAIGESRKGATRAIRSGLDLAQDMQKLLANPVISEAIRSQTLSSQLDVNIDVILDHCGIIKDNTKNLDLVKPSLKAAENNVYYQLAAKMSDALLEGLNMDDYVAFTKLTEPDLQEGNRVKYSVYALNSLNILASLLPIEDLQRLSADEMASKISESDLDKIYEKIFLHDPKFKTGLKRVLGLLPETSKTKDGLAKFNKELESCEDSRDKKRLPKFILEGLKEVDILAKLSDLVIDLFDFKYLDHQMDCDNYRTLSIVCIRHLAIINKCFPNISNYPNIKAKLEENFLKRGVLEKNGWSNFEVRTKTQRRSGFQVRPLDFNLLLQKIKATSQEEKYSQMAQCLSLDEMTEEAGRTGKKRQRQVDPQETILDSAKRRYSVNPNSSTLAKESRPFLEKVKVQ